MSAGGSKTSLTDLQVTLSCASWSHFMPANFLISSLHLTLFCFRLRSPYIATEAVALTTSYLPHAYITWPAQIDGFSLHVNYSIGYLDLLLDQICRLPVSQWYGSRFSLMWINKQINEYVRDKCAYLHNSSVSIKGHFHGASFLSSGLATYLSNNAISCSSMNLTAHSHYSSRFIACSAEYRCLSSLSSSIWSALRYHLPSFYL